MSKLIIAGATVNQTPLDWEGNFENIHSALREAISKNVSILCLPELCLTGYGSEDLFLSYWYPKKAMAFLKKLLPLCKNITVCIGTPVRIMDKVYNCIAVVENERLLALVPKQYLAIDGVHYEFRWFTPWEAGKVIDLEFHGDKVPFGDLVLEKDGLKYGFEICEDAWRGSLRPGFRLKDRKVDLIFNPSASHFAMGKSETREELVKESSSLLEATYFYVNLLGNESGRMIFDGEIFLANKGKIKLKNPLLSFQSYQLLLFDFHNQPPDLPANELVHDKNSEFTSAVTLALFDYLRKSKSRGFVLSLSGGADSSSIAVMVAEMVKRGISELGTTLFLQKINMDYSPQTDNPVKEIIGKIFFTAYQSSENSSTATLESAKMLAENLGAKFFQWSIQEEVDSYTHKIENAIGRKLNWELDDLALQNIQARARSPIIWMLANIKNSLLLNTSNRSEGDVGYTTMDGDTSGSISPIAAVDKYFLLSWLRWAENQLGYTGLKYVNSLQPTAELRPVHDSQTDERDLMPYSVIVEIEKLAIRDRRTPLDIYLILKEELFIEPQKLKTHIQKFFRLWSRNQWKRERLAASFHLDEFNVDPKTWYRFPILSGGYEEELQELERTEEE